MFGKFYAVHSVLTDNTAPEGIVQIQNHALFGCTTKGLNLIDDFFRHLGKHVHRNGHLCDIIQLGIREFLPATGCLDSIQINYVDIFYFLTALHQKIIQFALLEQEGIGCFIAVLTEAAVIQQGKITLQDRGPDMGIHLFPDP